MRRARIKNVVLLCATVLAVLGVKQARLDNRIHKQVRAV
jgi:hypothetical protein